MEKYKLLIISATKTHFGGMVSHFFYKINLALHHKKLKFHLLSRVYISHIMLVNGTKLDEKHM